jgi:hypothetical protein
MVKFSARSNDFSLKHGNPRMKFSHRQRIKVCPDRKGEGIASAWRRRDVVRVHNLKVAGEWPSVNKLQESCGETKDALFADDASCPSLSGSRRHNACRSTPHLLTVK